MIGRLGQVLYWGFTGFGAILVLIAGLVLYMGNSDAPVVATVCAFAAGLSWLIGRACLYVLAGR